MTKEMQYTGERMMPEQSDLNTYWEHVFRYAFVCKKVANLRVLDIASGEGYGTHALSRVAKSVVGVDISPEAIDHAKRKYGLDFRVGSAESIPLKTGSVDAVVSFETIEHVSDPVRFINEASRVLSPHGYLYISTPNKDVYRKDEEPNPFHCSELSLVELKEILQNNFEVTEIHGQMFPLSTGRISRGSFGMVSERLAFFGYKKFQNLMKRVCFPQMLSNDESTRAEMISRIHELSPAFERFWNPYAIRRFHEKMNGQPTYLLALARKR